MVQQFSLFDSVEEEKKDTNVLVKPEAKAEIEALVKRLNKQSFIYYVLSNDSPEAISDKEFDDMYDRLLLLEQQTGYILPDSPTQRVGSDILSDFPKHTHINYQLSSDKFHDGEWEKLKKFVSDVKEVDPNATFSVEYKFDGLTIAVTYENGLLKTGATRGDGRVGDEVTGNVKTVKTVPLSIPDKEVLLELTGECIMPLDKYNEFNDNLEALGKKTLSNPRNGASGSLKQLNPNVTAKRPLDVYFYNISSIKGKDFSTHAESLEWLKSQGFKVTDYKILSSYEEIMDFIADFQDKRDTLNFDIDGLVIKVNKLSTRKVLGATNKFPKWMLAYKFPPRKAITQIKSVVNQVGKTGVISVKAIVEKVNLGVNVTSVTLNNFEDVARKDIRIGDYVTIIRSGDVIPKIIEVHYDRRNGTEQIILPPRVCPSCGAPVHKGIVSDGETETAAVYCSNKSSCPAQLKRSLEYFCSKECMNIEIGRGISELLVDSNLVNKITDIYDLTEQDLSTLEGFKEKKIANLLGSIKNSLKRPFSAVLTALNIEMVGKVTAELLTDRFLDIDTLAKSTFDELTSVEGVGSGIATRIIEFFGQQSNVELVAKLRDEGANLKQEKKELNIKADVQSKKFVITGTLSKPRSAFEVLIKDAGGKVSSSVSSSTNYLVVGTDAGSKLTKAEEINKTAKNPIKILNEEQFFELFK